MKSQHTILMAVLLGLSLLSCRGRKGMLPSSGGSPYEVTVVGDVDSLVYRALSADVECMPQSEPMFDVRESSASASDALDGVLRYARSLVVVDINPDKYDEVSLGLRNNMYANPQLILQLCAPSVAALCDESSGCPLGGFSQKIISTLMAYESRAAISAIRRSRNQKMEDEVRRMFGIDMLIPADMTSCKRGKDFLWISNNSPSAMLNICVYSHEFCKRDSVMRVNIKGETDSMYMTTVHEACRVSYVCKETKGIAWHDWRGLWEMKGDAMGGPLVARTFWGLNPHTPVTVEGFVYAPGQKKRNHVMRLEAVVQTVRKRVVR